MTTSAVGKHICSEFLSERSTVSLVGVCGISYQDTIMKMKEMRVEFACAECRPTFEAIERDHAAELRKLRKKRMAPVKKEGLRSRELVPEGKIQKTWRRSSGHSHFLMCFLDRKLFFSIVSLLLALDSRNESSIPYQKLNMLSYESFLKPEYRPIVERLKG